MTRGSIWLQSFVFLACSFQTLSASAANERKEAKEYNFDHHFSGFSADLSIFGNMPLFDEPFPVAHSSAPVVAARRPENASTRPGLINYNFVEQKSFNVCYMNSVITSLFAAVPFRSLIYRSTPVSVVMFYLASLFGSLQTGTKPIRTDLFFRPSFSTSYPEWTFGVKQCPLDFTQKLLNVLGDEVDAKLKFICTKYRILDTPASREAYEDVISGKIGLSALLKYSISSSEEKNSFHQVLPRHESVQALFDSGFRLETYEGKYLLTDLAKIDGREIDPADMNATASVTVFDFDVVQNAPEMFVMGLNRTSIQLDPLLRNPNNYDQVVFCSSRMEVNPLLEILDYEGGVHTYKLQSFVHYWESCSHYVGYVCDYSENDGKGTWYLYNDSTVTVLRTQNEIDDMFEKAATRANLLVYVRSDVIEEPAPEVPERYMSFVNLADAINDIDDDNEGSIKAYTSSPNRVAKVPVAVAEAVSVVSKDPFPNLHKGDYFLTDLKESDIMELYRWI